MIYCTVSCGPEMTRMNGRKMGAIRVLQKAISFFLIVAQYSTPICSSSEMDETLESMDQTLESITTSSSHSGIYRSGLKEPGMEIGSDTFDPDRIVVCVDDFGAVGDGYTDDTEAFKDAWNEACSSGPSILLVPRGKVYLVTPLNFSGPCQYQLTVQISGTIIAPEDPSVWHDLKSNYWLLFHRINDLTIGGGGLIYGSGEKWWAASCKINKTNPCRSAPTAVTFESNNDLLVRNLNVKNSQQIHISFKNCFGVEASNLVVTAPEHSPNTDGIHITASTFVVVQNSVIGTGDDCVSIVSDSFDIVIQNVNCGPGHGISIGSLGKGKSEARVAGVLVDRVFLHDTTNGLRIKTWQGGSGFAQAIKYQNVYMRNVSYPIIIDQYYCDSPKSCKNQTSAVEVSDVLYDNISGTSATDEAIRFACSDSVPCENILLRNIDLRLTSGDDAASFCESVMGFSLGSVTPPPCFEDWAAEFHQG